MKQVRFAFPWPEMGKLSANSRESWRERMMVARERKEDAIALIREQGFFDNPIESGTITITWHVNDNRRRDYDNLLPEVKPYLDALTATGVIVDDNAKMFRYVLAYEHGEPNVQIQVDGELIQKGDS